MDAPLVKAADQKFCAACGTVVHVSAVQCPKCGAAQPQTQPLTLGAVAAAMPPAQKAADQKFCAACGAIMHQSATACPRCGAPQAGAAGTKSRTTAIVLALLLGGIGAHKFYLGSIGMGIVYLIFCWTFIPAVAGLIEGIIYATMSDAKFAQKYG